MAKKKHVHLLLGVAVLLLISAPAFAQKFEVHPYAGGFFPGKWADTSEFKNSGLFGVKGGVFFTEAVEVEGNFGYINHFEFTGNDTKTRATLWDVNGSYNFSQRKGVRPYGTFGLGGLTANTNGASMPFSPMATVKNNDTFLTLNYGGGVKALRLWGPMGLRADARGRTLPNFYSRGNSWLEMTGGVTFSWGER